MKLDYLFLLILLLLGLSLYSQNEVFKEAEHSFYEYVFEGKEASKVKADSLLTVYVKQSSSSKLNSRALLLKSLTKDKEERFRQLDSLKSHSNEVFYSDPFFSVFYQFSKLKSFEDDEVYFKSQFPKDSLLLENNTSLLKAYYYFKLAERLYYNKKYQRAVPFVNITLAILDSTANYKPIQAHRNKGGIYYALGNRSKAMYHFNESYQLAIKEPNPDSNLLTSLAWNLGVFNFTNSNHEASIPYLITSITHFELARGNDPYLISRYALLSDAYFYTGDYKKAEVAALKAKQLLEEVVKTDDVYLNGLVASSLSRIYAVKGDFEKARNYLTPALEKTIETFGPGSSLSAAFTADMANLEWNAGELLTAEKYFNNAIEMAFKTDRVYTKTAALSDIIGFLTATEQYKKALPFIETERDLLKNNSDTLSIIYAANNYHKADALLGLGNIKQAQVELINRDSILKYFKGIDTQLRASQALQLKLLLKKYEKTKDVAYLDAAIDLFDKFLMILVKGKSTLDYDASKMFYGEQISDDILIPIEIAYNKLQLDNDLHLYTKILQFMEINKSSALLDGFKNQSLANNYNVDTAIFDLKKKVISKIDSVTALLNDTNSSLNQDNSNNLIDTELMLQNQVDSINQILKKKHPDFYNASTLSISKSLSHYQEKILTNNEVVLEYYVANKTIYRLMITKQDVSFDVLINVNELVDDVLLLQKQLKNRESYQAIVEKISNQLLPSFPNNMERLTIIADDVLNSIPFEILQQNNANLITICPIRYAGSLQLLEQQMLKVNTSKNNWGGFAPQYVDDNLVSNNEEVLSIQKKMKGDVLLNEYATKKAFKETSKGLGIIHLATHGVLDQINPLNNSLLFSDYNTTDSELTLQEIYGLNLDAQLAVLSACETGTGKYEKGDGVMNLSRAFNYAGVSSTVVSLWKVPDKETSKIMVQFYENLKNGKPKDIALQQAKLYYLKNTSDPLLKHPYYWAGFIISGDVSPIESGIHWSYFMAAFVIAIAIVYRIFKKRKQTLN